MSGPQLAFLILVIAAFTLYGLVLAWAAWWTRDRRPAPAPQASRIASTSDRRTASGPPAHEPVHGGV